jgi:beta-aspartyl-peptidase (threonine type)
MIALRLALPLLLTLGCAHGPAANANANGPADAHRCSDQPSAQFAAAPGPAAANDAAAVHLVLANQVAAWNRGDLEGYMAGYWRSPQLTFFAGGTVTTGWDQTLARYRRRYQGEGKAMGQLEFANLEVELLGPAAALARGRWVLHFDAPAAKPAAGLFTVVLRRLPEGWRVVHDHSCSD